VDIPKQNLQVLFRQASQETLPPGTKIIKEAAPADHLYLILQGYVGSYTSERKSRADQADAHHLVDFVDENGFIGLPELFLSRPHKYTYKTFGETRIVSIPAAALFAALKTDWVLLKSLLGEMSQRIHGLVHQIDSLKTQRAEQRLAAHFLELMERQGKRREIVLPYGKKDLADHLGLAPESLSRALKRLKERGVEVHGRTIIVHTRQALTDCLESARATI